MYIYIYIYIYIIYIYIYIYILPLHPFEYVLRPIYVESNIVHKHVIT